MSYKIGARKPETAAFNAAAAALSLRPASCAFVDDLGAVLLSLLNSSFMLQHVEFNGADRLDITGVNLKAAKKLGFSTVKMLSQ